jgi:hypothetical protein
MAHSDVQVGPVSASTIYLFDPSEVEAKNSQENLTLTEFRGAPPRFDADVHEPETINRSSAAFALFSRRRTQ